MVLPVAFVRQFPKDYAGDYFELDVDRLALFLVPQDKVVNKAFKLVHHHHATQVSVPRVWLRDRGAVPGDCIELWEDSAQSDRVMLRFVPKASNPTAAAKLKAPVFADFRRVGE